MRSKILTTVFFIAICILFSDSRVYSQTEKNKILADQVVQIKGKVTTLDDEEKKISVVSRTVIFQRLDCKKCLVATRTNLEGEYEILVSRGKYKVFVYGFNDDQRLYDVVSKKQNSIVNAQDNYRANVFDIELTFIKSSIESPKIKIDLIQQPLKPH